VLKGVPVQATLTTANDSETVQLRATLQKQRLYVGDRGYADYQLFQDIITAGSDFVGRIRVDATTTLVESRPLTAADRPLAFAAIVWSGWAAPRVAVCSSNPRGWCRS
jgi:hypothetical protein